VIRYVSRHDSAFDVLRRWSHDRSPLVSVARTRLARTPLVYRHSGTWDSLEIETARPTFKTLVNCERNVASRTAVTS
jgi:hypothetical protein